MPEPQPEHARAGAVTPGARAAPERAPAAHLGEHVRRTAAIALPVMLARTGILLLIAADTAMTGQFDTTELAYYGLSMSPQMPMVLFGIGMMMGAMVLTAQAMGADDRARTGHVWRASLRIALVLGTLLGALCQLGEPVLLALGQPARLAEGAASVLAIFGFGMPAMLMFAATSFFLEAAGHPRIGMVVMIGANIVNIALNWVLIFGNLGLPAMGADGAALATTIVRWLMVLTLAGFALLRLDARRYGITGAIADRRGLARRLRALGTPMGIAHAMESAAFSCLLLFAGWLGVNDVASYQLSMNLTATVFMAAIGISAAASIRVGNAIGRGDMPGVRIAGWVAVGLAIAVLAAIALTVAAAPHAFATIYTRDATVVALAVPTLLVAAVAMVPDGVQGVLIGALRGAGDVWPATVRYLVSFWGVMVPAGYVLGVHAGFGSPGLMAAVAIGTTVATVLLGLRFHRVSFDLRAS